MNCHSICSINYYNSRSKATCTQYQSDRASGWTSNSGATSVLAPEELVVVGVGVQVEPEAQVVAQGVLVAVEEVQAEVEVE